jgi:serine/threonine-protein kinase
MTDLTGTTVGKFEIVEKLGGGGMADVYKAYQSSLNRHVAIKVIHRFLAQEERFLTRFHREAQHVASLRHPSIVQVFDFDVFEGQPYMVMEFIDGPTLGQRMRERQAKKEAWSLEEVIAAIGEVGSALAFAHEKEMIHRDIKPANVMCDPSGRYILTDFGLAKMLSGPSFTATGTVMGTPAYMSPEQCQGKAGEAGSDIYSLGIVLYELATGQLPFDADSQYGYLMKHVNDPPPPPNSINPELPRWLTSAILKALKKEAEERFQTVDELLESIHYKRDTVTLPPPAGQEETTRERPTEIIPAVPESESGKPKAKAKKSRFGGLRRPKIKLPDVKVPGVTLDDLRQKAEGAVAALEEQQDKLSARRLETTERVRKGLQTRLEMAVDKTVSAQRARYAILSVGTDDQIVPAEMEQITGLIEGKGGQLADQSDTGVIALFELEDSGNEAEKRAIDTGLELAQSMADAESPLHELKSRLGIHTGTLPTKEVTGEAIDIVGAVKEAAPIGRVLVSHATFSRVRDDYQFDKLPSIRQPGTNTPVQIYLVLP